MAPSCGEQEFIANFPSHKLVAKQTGVEALVQSLPPKFHCQDQLEYHENDNELTVPRGQRPILFPNSTSDSFEPNWGRINILVKRVLF